MNITGKISVSQHAIDRAVERFRVPKLTADEWIRSNLRKATFIANIVSDDGKPNRLYAFQRIAFAVAEDVAHVYTVYSQNYAVTYLQRKVAALLKRELASAERKERSIERKVNVAKARIGVQIAECKLRMEVTPSRSVIARNQAFIALLSEKLTQLDAELTAAKREKAAVAKSLIAYL